MRFSGHIRLPEIDHSGIPAVFLIDDVQVELVFEGESLGRWSLYDVYARRLVSSAFRVELAEEEITFLADDPTDFAYRGVEHMADVWARFKSMNVARRPVAVRRSRKGATPSKISELRDAMVENLEPERRGFLTGEEPVRPDDITEESVAQEIESVEPGPETRIPVIGETTGDEADRFEAQRAEAERVEQQRLESEILETEKPAIDKERARLGAEKQSLEAERLKAEQMESDRVEAFRLEMERLESEREDQQRLEAMQSEASRQELENLQAEREEMERRERERLESGRLEVANAEAELEQQRADMDLIEAERAESSRKELASIEKKRKEIERLGTERAKRERLDAERREAIEAEMEQLEAQRAEGLRQEAARVRQERLEARKLEKERINADKAAAKQAATARAEQERLTRKLEKERINADKAAAKQAAAARVEQERADAKEPSDEGAVEETPLDMVKELLSTSGTGDDSEGGHQLVVDLSEFEERSTEPESGSDMDSQPEPALPGAPRQKSGIMGALKGAINRTGRKHVHQLVDAPGGVGIGRSICEDCGYVGLNSEPPELTPSRQ